MEYSTPHTYWIKEMTQAKLNRWSSPLFTHENTDLKVFVVVIPIEGLAGNDKDIKVCFLVTRVICISFCRSSLALHFTLRT